LRMGDDRNHKGLRESRLSIFGESRNDRRCGGKHGHWTAQPQG
jgi:hypothetical protein